MQDQRVIWSKLNCFKPSFLALTRRGTRTLTGYVYEGSLQTDFPTRFVLSSILPASKKRRQGNEREPKSLSAYSLLTKRGSPKPGRHRKLWLLVQTMKTRHGDGVLVVVRGRESLPHGEGEQVIQLKERSRYAQCRRPKSFSQC
jgi:hypothetical protein